ncbi:hypothetical protein UFOVP448_17 [uncultured Caudovirales phage]|uniref:Uncharacterized protein n=1 Tax=uncultured Caudovirales phage TaxID=2100421 RepID=A0A6J5MB10_9CAUD|nr:hypothetical protein UFOVP448_17 [uncultured Caudovirales phage]
MLLCGIDIETDDTNDAFYDTILSINGFGVTRTSVDMTSNKQAAGWGIMAFSCIKRLKPFTLELLLTGNIDWKTKIGEIAKDFKIKFPAEAGFTAGVIVEFKAAITDVTITGSIENRSTISVQVTPSGEPTVTAAVAA